MSLSRNILGIVNDKSPFVGPLISLFWTCGDISIGFQSQSCRVIKTKVKVVKVMREFIPREYIGHI